LHPYIIYVPKPTIWYDIPANCSVNVGLAKFAFFKQCSVVADTGLFASAYYLHYKPTIAFVIPPIVPVNVGLAKFAFKVQCTLLSRTYWFISIRYYQHLLNQPLLLLFQLIMHYQQSIAFKYQLLQIYLYMLHHQ
jgi:hypothetical protein